MASYEYRITVDSEEITMTIPGHARAVEVCRAELNQKPNGSKCSVERRQAVYSLAKGRDYGPWLIHRAYVVGPDGIIRRTDRTP